jgi:hypothetical protein
MRFSQTDCMPIDCSGQSRPVTVMGLLGTYRGNSNKPAAKADI